MVNQIREAGSQHSYVTFSDLSNFITRFSDFVRKSVGGANPDLFQVSAIALSRTDPPVLKEIDPRVSTK